MEEARNPLPPNVLIFPFPAQGHVNSMLKLAELLAIRGIHITFLLTKNIHDRLLLHTSVLSRFAKYPASGFYLETLPLEITQFYLNSDSQTVQLYDSLNSIGKPYLRDLLLARCTTGIAQKGCGRPPITSIIADGILSVALDVAEEFRLPLIYFRTIGASAFWSYFCLPQLIQAEELPFTEEDMDKKVANVTGMEDLLRYRDLPSMCRATDLATPFIQMLLKETMQTPRARGLILNTFENLEQPILSLIRSKCTPNLYTIGPLNAHLKSRIDNSTSGSSNSLWEEDRSCIKWLDMQPPKSVIYVSFGSIAVVTRDEMLEFWHGLVNSGTRFLWVMRPDLVTGKDQEGGSQIEEDEMEVLKEATAERGNIVEWAPQEEVLGHPAVGGFLTHSGWNSTLESIVEGVPMICWPFYADQQINSRFVEEAWKLGLDMKDTCNREIVEKMIREIMVVRKDEFSRKAEEMANLANNAISNGGSSFSNLDRLLEDIWKMSNEN